MHLLQKSPKYAFAYAGMQMHNYPKPIHHLQTDVRVFSFHFFEMDNFYSDYFTTFQ